ESEEKDTTELWQKLDENRKAYQEAQRKYQHSYLGYEKTKTEKRKLGVSNESIGNLAHKEEQKKIVAVINKKLSSDQLRLASDGIDKDLFDVAPPQGSGGIGNKMSSDDLSGTVVSMKKKLSTDNLDLAKHFEGGKEKRRSTRHQEKRAENREVMANLKYFMYYDNTSKFKAELNRESLDVAKKNLEELPAFSRLVKSEPEELAKYLVAPGAVAANIGEASSVFVPIKRTKSTKNLFKQTKDVNVDKIQDAFDDSGETSFELDTKTQYSKKRKFAPPKKKSESSIFSGNLLFQEDMDQNDSDSLRRYSMGTSSQEDSPKKGSSKKGIF
ncbi:MAG: hypothetical protein Q4B50_05125, partial [Bacillota bacterium]|nr:hypothetical protein [Bacillota bacterium]